MSVMGFDRPLKRFPNSGTATHVQDNPCRERLRAWSAHLETTSAFGAPAYVSEHKSRSADRTSTAVDDRFAPTDWSIIQTALRAVNDPGNELVCIDRQIGRHPDTSFHCRLFVPRAYSRIGLGWMNLLESTDSTEPDFITVQLPQFEETAIRVLPESGITCVLGSDYTGEAKKSFLRLFMYRVKQQGGLGLHAGSKRLRVCRNGDLQTIGQLFLGLSATGKTTLTCHDFGLTAPESAAMLQDDVCALLPDGTVAGSEGGGLYIKTMGLGPDEQAPLYSAVNQPDAVLENVVVNPDGSVAFDDDRLTRNARAVVQRDHVPQAANEINLPRVDQVFFITRNPLMPPVARLTPAQAATTFMLGESIETSAGDPENAGQAVRVVGTNPFIIGSRGIEGNRFHDLITPLGVECYLLNTGEIGPDGRDIRVEDTVSIVRAIARDTVTWREDARLGLSIPREVPGMSIGEFYPPDYVPEYDQRRQRLRRERSLYLKQFSSLDESINSSVY